VSGMDFQISPEPPGYTEMAPLAPDGFYELLQRIEDAKRIIVCSADDFDRINRQVVDSGLGAYYRVQPQPWLDPGTAYILDPAALKVPEPDGWAD